MSHPLVAVTGASGFIASHLIAQLLERGYRVRGTVRSLSRPEKYQFLRDLPGAERLELMEAELLQNESYDQAVSGCEIVFHTASPYIVNAKDPQKDLVDPAVKGTINVLKSCQRSASVKRVVLTSSVAAISDEPVPGHVFTESDWNEKSTLKRNPYYLSKVLAEKAAWAFVKDNQDPFSLVVINPLMVIGPSLGPSLNESNAILRDMISGVYPGIMDLTWGLIDVRDVALAHILAAENTASKGRYLCANTALHMEEVAARLRAAHFDDGYKLPKMNMRGGLMTGMMKFFANFQPSGVRSYLKTHLGKVMLFDHSKAVDELGLTFRPVEQTILEAAHDLIKWEHLEAKNKEVQQYLNAA